MSEIRIIRCRHYEKTFYIHLPTTAPLSSLEKHLQLLLDHTSPLRLIKMNDVNEVEVFKKIREEQGNNPESIDEASSAVSFQVLDPESAIGELMDYELVYIQLSNETQENGENNWESLSNIIEPLTV